MLSKREISVKELWICGIGSLGGSGLTETRCRGYLFASTSSFRLDFGERIFEQHVETVGSAFRRFVFLVGGASARFFPGMGHVVCPSRGHRASAQTVSRAYLGNPGIGSLWLVCVDCGGFCQLVEQK